ncbi:MAG: carboxypeptidase-like regulatory domain-containing protein [Ignavibacteriaceae bacterium]|nr:carboxypeptidase-like regulatory domain-containing protein [Ignavibacteriaceae bacterium]
MKVSFSKIFSIFLFLTFSVVYAQSGVGKLVGKVIDAGTKEALIGANVLIVGSAQGAATDVEGRYFILNVTPGTYEVKVSYVGYGPKTIQDVRIVANITYELNVELSTDFTLPTIEVSSKKFFEEKSTNTTKVLDADQISKLPVKGVEKLAGLQSGVVIQEGSGGADGNATINVRGGRGGEVLYIVDGVPQNDILFGGNSAQVSNNAIDQLSFQIGGYEAKYGQAQSGIVNVTTKSGSAKYSFFGDVLSSTFTDDYGYNLYSANIGGPIIPGNANHTMFLSGERGWFGDANPRAIDLVIPTMGISTPTLPNNSSSVWRFSGRTMHNFQPFSLRLGANINTRTSRSYTHTYAKNNTEHNPLNERENYSFSGRFSHNVSNSMFYNINIGYKIEKNESGDGLWFDNIEAYGDTAANKPWVRPGVQLIQGTRVSLDPVQLFYDKGRVSNSYSKLANDNLTIDVDFTNQLNNHLIEIGGGYQFHTLRYWAIGPVGVAIDNNTKTLKERIALQRPFYFGFDILGNESDADENTVYGTDSYTTSAAPRNPSIAYVYLQDRFELSDLVLNLGIRWDYFDSQADVVKDELLPYAGGSNPDAFDDGDFKIKDAESYISPRIGVGFPVTESTVFHAQFGKFIQQPRLIDVFTSTNSLDGLVTDGNFGVNTGNINSEVTTQYEIGFRQVLVNNAGALNLTAFYKNTKGLVNDETRFFYRAIGGQRDRFYGPANSDFGTIKGLALSLTVGRMDYFSFNVEYTYSLAEGTGSSTGSSTTAAFRNNNGETPKVIAPLDFDQRHTGVVNVDFSVPKGDLGFFERTSANFLVSFSSGRPYTPLEKQNITPGGGSNLGDTKGYVNSAYGPGNFRVDFKLEKSFEFGGAVLTPYLWIENLFDADNVVNVYRSTGSPVTSGYLKTPEGAAVAASRGQSYVDDYIALERDPNNFGIPRLIKLGFRVNFANINF